MCNDAKEVCHMINYSEDKDRQYHVQLIERKILVALCGAGLILREILKKILHP